MGMYDYFRSSYDLGEHFTNVICQTKDIEDHDIGGTMSLFWLDPSGVLWESDYDGTHELEYIKEGEPEYNKKLGLFNLRWIKTGKHGKLRVRPITKYITIYPENYKGLWKNNFKARLHFREGVLQDYSFFT